jgi:hypothetical protein
MKEALSLSSNVRKPIAHAIHDPSRSIAAPPIPFQSAKPHEAEKGFLNIPITLDGPLASPYPTGGGSEVRSTTEG